MVDCLEQFLHVACCFSFAKCLVCLLCDLVEELTALDILHDKIDILRVVISLEIFDDVRMIESIQDGDFFHDTVNILSQFVFIEDFDCDMEICFEFICCHEYSSEGSNSKNFGLIINNIVLFELMDTLLFSSLVD